MDIKLTPDQTAAVKNTGGNLLVSAAAGSGKTKVLVERLLEKVLAPSGEYDIDDFLIITYTKAAAAELRGKILDAVYERIAVDPENKRLRRQADLCCHAQIGTIHSFCAKIIRENAHLLGISPDFRVADEAESEILRRETLSDMLDDRYDEYDPGFIALADTMGSGRDDSKLVDIVLDTYSKLMSHPYPERWVKTQMEEVWVDGIKDVSETVWGDYIIERAKNSAKYLEKNIKNIFDDTAVNKNFISAYGPSLSDTLSGIREFLKALDESWDKSVEAARMVRFSRPKPVKGYEELKNLRAECKKAWEKLASLFTEKSDKLLADIATVKPAVEALLKLVLDFEKAYSENKRKRNILDFSDQEHMALKLLADENGKPTQTAKNIARRYAEIMVDEYQDVNAVQELIFRCISDGNNVFMVGDVKQSIYRFRLADPTIFLRKYQSFKNADEAEDGENRKIVLSMNFRSKAGILSAVNFIFKNTMSEKFGEMEYTEREYLYPGANYLENNEPCVELDVIDMAGEEKEEESADKTEKEAQFAANRIAELVATMNVSDGAGGSRPARFGDVAILMRSVTGKAPYYAAALAKLGIPTSLETGSDFFQSIEVSLVISLLSVIDNPRQDIPLIAVMRSPMYNFSADDLAECRVCLREGDFWSAVILKAETDEKFAAFVSNVNKFRDDAIDMTSDELLWHIYGKTGLFALVGAMDGGEKRRSNLMQLLEFAKNIESTGYKGVFGFITYLRKMMEEGNTPEVAAASSGNAVTIMSIHKSKGLEFPIVFLVDTAKKFNTDDSKKPLLIHSELGVGPKYTDLQRRIEYPTLARTAVRTKIISENLSEELRVLYVAMTRAREKLVITCSYKDAEKSIAKYMNTPMPVSPQIMEAGSSVAEWILRSVLRRVEASALRFGRENVPINDDGERWLIRLIRSEEILSGATVFAEEEADTDTDDIDKQIRKNLSWSYPYTASAGMPSKITATELKGSAEDAEAQENAERIFKGFKKAPKRPSFMAEKQGLTAAERGTAAHIVMQYAKYEECVTKAGAEKEIERLRRMNTINDEQAAVVNPDIISGFFNSQLGRRLLKAQNVWRELKFSLLVDSGEIPGMKPGEETLLQGVVDCCFEEDGKLVIVDFKTDYVTDDILEEKKKYYSGQVMAYAMAMEKILERPVGGTVLYFLTSGITVNI